MNLTLLTIGTRGDIQPFAALGQALQRRGHTVRIAGPDNFADWVAAQGLEFHPIGIDMEAFLQSPEARAILAGRWWGLIRLWRKMVVPMMQHSLAATWRAAQGADVIVYHPKAMGAVDVAEALDAVPVCALPIPMVPTCDFPVPITARDFGARLNRASYRVFTISRLVYRKYINQWRRETLGLGAGFSIAPVGGTSAGLAMRLCMVSPAVIPRPRDWDGGAHMTGYWFLDEDPAWEPDPGLAAFLASGPPPVYIGFGSMTAKDPGATARIIVESAQRAGVRVLFASGWGGLALSELPEQMYLIESAPHDKLFQHVQAVVHHGGAGSTAAGLRAGLPTLICPFTVDQPFWGHRVWRLGCGPRPRAMRRLEVDDFAAALRDLVENPAYREKAAAIGAAIWAEDGVARAVELIEAARPEFPSA